MKEQCRLHRALVEVCRPFMILASFFTQTPSVMSQPEWKMTPLNEASGEDRSSCSGAVSDLDFLLEIFADLPVLFRQTEECMQYAQSTDTSPSFAKISIIYNRVRHLKQELQNVRERLYGGQCGNISATLSTITTPSVETMPWVKAYCFNSVEHAITFTMYHTAIILANTVPILLLHAALLGRQYTMYVASNGDQNVSVQGLCTETKASIHNICRSIDYYLQFLHPSDAPADYYLLFPIYVARQASIKQSYSVEAAWLKHAMKAMKSKYSMGMCANIDFDNGSAWIWPSIL